MAEKTGLCLSVMQPWAWLIVNGFKDIENRDWRTRVRGIIGIHASKTIDTAAIPYIRRTFPLIELPDTFEVGGIVGRSELVDCLSDSDSEWFTGLYGLLLRHSEPLPFMPCRGMPGFFRPKL